MKNKSHWLPLDNESNWMLVGTIFGMIVLPILIWLAIGSGLAYLIWWIL